MFGGQDGLRRMLSQDQLKPKNVGSTLARFGRYFGSHWPALIVVLALVLASTWMQVTTPELTGQVVDCYLTSAAAPAFGGAGGAAALGGFPGSGEQAQASSNCWLASDSQQQSPLWQFLRRAIYTGTEAPTLNGLTQLEAAERIAGLGRVILALIALYVGGAILTGAGFYVMTWAGQHVLRQMRVDVFRHLHRLSQGYYAEHEAGDLMSRITNDATAIEQAFGFALIQVFGAAVALVWTAYNMLAKSVPFALLSMIVLPLMAGATYWLSERARRAFRASRREMGSVNAELQESIAAVREVQAFNRAEENIEQFRLTNAANRDANVRAVAYTSALPPILEALGYVALAVVTSVGGLALLRPDSLPFFAGTSISLGLVVTFLGYAQRFNQPIQQIALLWTNVQNAIAGGERIFGLLDEVPAVQDRPDASPMPEIQGRVEFDGVSAHYKVNEPVLRQVSFTAEPGQTIAIVGPTGAGKTTLINLIPRFYDVTAGAVRIDGRDVRRVTAESLRRQIGIVLQDTFLFSATVMENIRFGRPEASDEEVLAAARLAHADGFIERLPEKYQTVLGERGSGLSQGQRQLIAIARAALADPRLLILDEATSSVDTRTERLIQRAFDQLLQERTSFVIAHRLSTVRSADLVLVLKDGQIVERGRFQELLERGGYFHSLYMSQFRQASEAAPGPGGNGRAEPAAAPA